MISLAPVYYEGQTLELSMPDVAGCTYAWFMNGEVVAEGPGENSLSHTFMQPGEYVLTFIETRAAGGGTECTQRAVAHTRVVPVPPVPTELSVNTETTFSPPPGYAKHAWSLDGQAVSTGAVLKHTFREPGSHAVECLASSPDQGPAQGDDLREGERVLEAEELRPGRDRHGDGEEHRDEGPQQSKHAFDIRRAA